MKNLLFLAVFLVIPNFFYAQNFDWPQAIEDGIFSETDTLEFCNSSITAFNSEDLSINNKEYVLTICPDDENQFVFFENIEVIWDGINPSQSGFSFEIYDGDSTESLLLASSTPTIEIVTSIATTSENTTGCLTIKLSTAIPALPPSFPTPIYGFSLDFNCHDGCRNILPQVSIDTDDLCSTSPTSSLLVSVDEEITLNANAFTETNEVVEITSATWLINGESFEGNSIIQTFEETGTVQGALVITDEFLCTSETYNFNLIVSDGNINISPQDEVFSLEELISNVMIGGSECTNVDNIQALVQSPNGTSIGYFSGDCSNFPFSEGLVIGSGGIGEIIGEVGSENSWSEPSGEEENNGTNEQILSILGGGQDSGSNVNDATVIEFEFSSFESEVSFNYIYASQEYTSSFPCVYADPFAFIVSGPGKEDQNIYLSNGNPIDQELLNLGGLNVATITPPGINLPIPTTATNIHPGPPVFNCGVGSLGEFNYPEFFNQLAPPYHSLNGESNVLTASFQVIPCETYTLKLMVGDWSDTILNSFVFIEGGSFDIGVDLGNDITANNESMVCYGEEKVLNIYQNEIDGNCNLSIDWSLDDEPIVGENDNPSISVTEPGVYDVFISGDETCNGGDQITVEFLPVAEFDFPFESICACSSVNQFEIDLVEELNPFFFLEHDGQGREIPFNATSLSDLGMKVTYFESETDALDFTNPIENPFNYPVDASTNQVWIRANESITGDRNCPTILSMDLVTATADRPAFEENQIQDLSDCNLFLENDNIDLTLNNAESLGSETPDEVNVTYHNNRIDALLNENNITNPETYTLPTGMENEKIFARLENTESDLCFNVVSFDVALNNVEIATTPLIDFYECKVENQSSNFVSFDLTLYDDVVLGNNQSSSNYKISYFTSLNNATNFINPIINETNYISSGETLWVRISKTNQVVQCFAVDEFELIVTEFGDPQCENLSTEDFQNAFSMYPNPTEGKLVLDYSEQFDIQRIDILNINGKKLFTSQSKLRELNFNDYPSGIYFIRILVNNNWVTKKIIRK